MRLNCSDSIVVPRAPEQVFALIDDFSSTHKWMERRIQPKKCSSGENAVGDFLRCFFRCVTKHDVLAGAIVSRRPSNNLACERAGRNVRIGLDFTMPRQGEGTYLTRTVHVVPTTILARLASPLIRRAWVRHSLSTATELRRHLLAVSGAGRNILIQATDCLVHYEAGGQPSLNGDSVLDDTNDPATARHLRRHSHVAQMSPPRCSAVSPRLCGSC